MQSQLDSIINSNQIVKLNIGGYKYETTVNTLTSGNPNFFSTLLLNDIPSFQDENGYYFIDRDGKYFEPILEFLRTGEMNCPPQLSKDAIFREADYYGIELPKHSLYKASITHGIFVSDKYRENEIIVFDDSIGYVIRGGTSKVAFNYNINKVTGRIEVIWQKNEKNKRLTKELSKKELKRCSEKRKSKIATLNDEQYDEFMESGSQKTNIWFLNGATLLTSSINLYTFIKRVEFTPGSIFYSDNSPIVLYEHGNINGFKIPYKVDEVENNYVTEKSSISNTNDSYLDSPEKFIYVDVRNQWLKCTCIKSKFSDHIQSYHITYHSNEYIRHKSVLNAFNNDYEMCKEAAVIEIIPFEKHLLARLLNYNLERKDGSLIGMQFSTSFHKYELRRNM